MKKSVLFLIICIALSAFSISALAEDTVLLDNKCEEKIENVTFMENGVDGTHFYRCDNGADIGFLPYEVSSDLVYEMDIRFNNEGCGFSFMKKGKWNSCIRIKDGQLALQTGGNSFSKLCPVDLNAWYHFTFLGRTNKDVNPVTYGHIILERYENGERVERQVFRNVNLRNNAATHYINAFGGCDIDNLHAFLPAPTKLEITSDAESVIAGGKVQFTALSFFGDLEMHGVNKDDISFELYDKEGRLSDENIAIDTNGLLTTKPLTQSCEIVVRAVSKSAGLYAEKPLKITSGSIFNVTAIGVSEEGDCITEITVAKNFAAYKDTVTFVVVFYNSDGSFKSLDFKAVNAKTLGEGENKVSLNISTPADFDVYSDNMGIFTITAMSAKVEAIKVTLDEAKALLDDSCTVIVLREGGDIASVKSEDVLFFDVTGKDKIAIPEGGKAYIMGSSKKIDTLLEIVK